MFHGETSRIADGNEVDKKKNSGEFVKEFLRYAVVGGVSAVADMAVNYCMLYFVLHGTKDDKGLVAASVTAGFIAGIVINYILSTIYVFRTDAQKQRGKNVGAFLIYVAVGIAGYGLTVGLTLLGTRLLRSYEGIWYIILTCVVKAIVLVWNYAGRKIFVYRGK